MVEPGPGEGLDDPVGGGRPQRAVGLADDGAHVHLLEGDHAARPHALQQPAQGGRRIVQVHQDQPADERVDRGGHGDLGQVLDDEGDVGQAGGAGPALGHRDRLGRPVDAEHGPGRADQPGGQERHVAGAAADVEDPHARGQAGPAQDLLGEVAEEAGLVDQAVELVAVVAEDVAGLLPAEGHGLGHGVPPGAREPTPVGDGAALPTRQTNRCPIPARNR